jgi:GNAT superfamily N-acetyltransferase
VSFVIDLLARHHHRSDFDCGELELDEFIRRHARQNQERNVSRTYVATLPGESHVLGYYTLASSAIAFERLPERVRRRLPRYPVPVVLLARLAVDRAAQGQRLGQVLLSNALRRAVSVADILGVFAVEVHAKHDRAREFYLRHGFEPFEDNPLNLYLPIDTIRRLL